MIYYCCDKRRRLLLKKLVEDRKLVLNGIDYLEVSENQETLAVHFITEHHLDRLTPGNFAVKGGERVPEVHISGVKRRDSEPYPGAGRRVVDVTVDTPGDFSSYVLALQTEPDKPALPDGFDPQFSSVRFSFKVRCPNEFDCHADEVCCLTAAQSPEIDYEARDYASLRQVMLDRLSVLMPGWKERNPADLGIALVEMLAYVGDQLSYRQDAIATEAYLGTARHRTSVRRHARLADYKMHDGCNARAWIRVEAGAGADGRLLPDPDPKHDRPGTRFLTQASAMPVLLSAAQLPAALSEGGVVFETMHDITLHTEHNEMHFHTWGDARCCLPRGATSATLSGSYPNLGKGDVLILAEVKGPGADEPADPNKRHPVRLTDVRPCRDQVCDKDVTEISWAPEDALPFAMCVSALDDKNAEVNDVSVAWGNIVLADHGLTWPLDDKEKLEPPVPGVLETPTSRTHDFCTPGGPDKLVPKYRPEKLSRSPLTFSRPPSSEPAARASLTGVEAAMPSVTIADWKPAAHMLDCGPFDKMFVVEVDDKGEARLRFGDGTCGARPEPNAQFEVRYRIGNGSQGNVGRGAIKHVICDGLPAGAIVSIDNPLPARGGTDPESIAAVRQAAPIAFRTQQRAVTPEDYEAIAQRHPEVQRARATFRWTGSWYTVFLAVDRKSGAKVDPGFEQEIRVHMDRFRLAGYDLEVEGPHFVSLEVELAVCVKPDHFRGDVEDELLRVLGGGVRPCGRLGLFHPDRLTFGQTIYLSRILAAAQAVPGVVSVRATTFRRWGTHDTSSMADMRVRLSRLEIARLDNDPNYPEHGVLRLKMEGGR